MTASSIWSRLGAVASLVATPLLPSHYVEMVRPLAATHVRRARVEAVRDEAPGVRTLTLRPGRGWQRHRAGQHVTVGLAIDGRLAARTFTISSSPDRADGCIEITVKAQGRVSGALVRDVEVGTFVTLGTPQGEFTLPGTPDTTTVRPLFITGGSGVTPVASIVRTAALRGAMPDAVHIHFARTAEDAIFGAELQKIADDHPSYRLISIATAGDPRRLDAARLDALVPDWRERDAWACGPASLIDAASAAFAAADREHALRIEYFRAPLRAANAGAAGGLVQFGKRGITARADGNTPLLQVAEQAGLAPPHGCRMGICHTCDTTLIAGCVRDLRTGAQIDEPGVRIQICVCAAAGDVELTL